MFDNCTVEYPSYLGDAYCDHGAGYNNMGCGWDGGDCCEDTCEREAAFYNCGVRGYTCLDPNSTNFMVCAALNVNTTLYDNGTNWGNGECDQFNHDLEKHLNSQICAWDGGDCVDLRPFHTARADANVAALKAAARTSLQLITQVS